MAQPVWVLSVDLQTKTATFQSGMADAAKTAKGAFTDIKGGASEMSGHVTTNMFASRHAIMAVSEAFGDTMPRAITALLVHLGPLGAALEAAFPYAAIGLAAVLLIEHMTKMREEAQKLASDTTSFGTAVNTTFNSLDQKMLQAEIRSDELRNDHIGALHKQLELIDKQSMAELVHSLGEVAKAADTVFGDLKGSWYSFGDDATHAKHDLEAFQTQYASLLAQGKDKEASDLLGRTRESAERILALQNQAKSSGSYAAVAAGGSMDHEDLLKHEAALNALRKEGRGYGDEEVQAQQVLVSALQAQVGIEERVAALKAKDSSNATASTGRELAALQAEAARTAAEHSQKMGELSLAAEREQASVSLAIHQASIAERLASDVALADKEYAIQLRGNQQLQAALDKGGKDYTNQLKGLQDKAAEMTAQHENTVAALRGKAEVATYEKSLADLEESEREKINATQQGTAGRLVVIMAAIKNEDALNLQATAHYRELMEQRVAEERAVAEETAKLQAEAGRLAAAQEEAMGGLALAALKERQALVDSARRVTAAMREQEDIEYANREFALKQTALDREMAALDKSGKDYTNKLTEIQNKEKQLVQAHENEITAIKDQAQKERNSKLLAAENRYEDEIASSLTQALMGQKSFASVMVGLANEVESGLLQAALKHIEVNLMTKESDAAKAARAGFNAGMELPFPANIVAAPVMAAGMYAQVMAFQGGTDYVPGIGSGDVTPAMLTPGEGVVPGGVMDGLRRMANAGEMGSGHKFYMKVHYAPQVHAIDANGVDSMLDKHGDKFQRHFNNALRKMNR